MNLAKVTTKGQITIPIEIRKKLGVREGDKILFLEDGGRIFLMNSSLNALRTAQADFAGAAEEAGIQSEEDLIRMLSDFRRERAGK